MVSANKLASKLSQITWWRHLLFAALGSLTVHGLVALMLPSLSTVETRKTPTLLSKVKFVELTTAEQRRLPISAAPLSLTDELPAVFSKSILPPAPQPRPKNTSEATSSALTPSYPVSSFKAANANPYLPKLPSLKPEKPTPRVTVDDGGEKKSSLPNQQPSSFPTAATPSVIVTASPSPPPPIAPDTPSPESSLVAPQVSPNFPEEEAPPAVTPTTEPSNFGISSPASPFPASTAEVPNFEISQPASPDLEVNPSPTDTPPQIAFDPTNTSNEAGATNYDNWATRSEITVDRPKKMTITGTYPENACYQKLNGEATVAVSIDKDRQPNYPEVIQSSGYQILDEQAITDTTAANFDKAAIAKPYLVKVKYKYKPSSCNSN
jgi:TonB family protein